MNKITIIVRQMSFRDNLDFEDRLARQVIFNSHLTTASIRGTVNALNTFAQNALDFFRGYIQLSLVERPYQAPPRLQGAAPSQRGRKEKDGGFLCELQLMVPKVMMMLDFTGLRYHDCLGGLFM